MMQNTTVPHILIVDDIAKNIQVVGGVLKNAGYHISFAQDGPTALGLMKDGRFDLILLDIMMPEMSGFEVCKILKKQTHTCDIPIIFLTAKNDIESISEAFNSGGVDYITKPFNNQELLVRVSTHLEIKKHREELQKLNITKDKLFSIIGHDLRGFFFNMLGAAEILQKDFKTQSIEDNEKFIEIIYRSGKSAYSVLENLLDWARNQLGKLEYVPEEIVIREQVDEVVEFLSAPVFQKKIHIGIEVPSYIRIFADKYMLNTILRNLISNAIKFTPNEGTINLSARLIDMNVEFSVCDSGVGIETDRQKSMFEISIGHTTYGTEGEKGTGIGLVLCRELVEKCGGRIWVISEIGKGADFRFTMPAIL